MGAAKRRGTFEQRKAAALLHAAEERQRQERQRAEREAAERECVAAMPPEEREGYRERKHQTYMRRAMLIGVLAGLGGIAAVAPKKVSANA